MLSPSIALQVRVALLAALLALAALPARARAEALAPVGPARTVAAQGNSPAVALAASGNGLLAWGTDCEGVMVRRLRPDGVLGPSRFFREVVADIRQVQAAGDAAGNFVVAWEEATDSLVVLAQRLRSDARPRGGLLRVNRGVSGDAVDPHLGVAPDGRFTVLFAAPEEFSEGRSLWLARFGGDGTRLGRPRRFETSVDAKPLPGDVVAGGAFLLAGWTQDRDCGSGYEEIRAGVARVGWSGAPTEVVARFHDGRVCDGGPILAGLLPSEVGPLAVLVGHTYNLQRLDPATGLPAGERTVFANLAPCSEDSCEVLAAVVGDDRGRFVVLWERQTFLGEDRYTLTAQLFGRDGGARTEPVVVTEEPSARGTFPAVALARNGTLHAVWQHAEDEASPSSILLRTLRVEP